MNLQPIVETIKTFNDGSIIGIYPLMQFSEQCLVVVVGESNQLPKPTGCYISGKLLHHKHRVFTILTRDMKPDELAEEKRRIETKGVFTPAPFTQITTELQELKNRIEHLQEQIYDLHDPDLWS